jgi:hypothetical protein
MVIDIHKVSAEIRGGNAAGPEVRELVEVITARVLVQVRRELRDEARLREADQPRTRVSEDRRIRR